MRAVLDLRAVMSSEQQVRDLVRRVVGRVLAERGRVQFPAGHGENASSTRTSGVHVAIDREGQRDRPAEANTARAGQTAVRGPELVTLDCLADVEDGTSYRVPPGAIVTDLAREEAWRRKIELSENPLGPGNKGRLRVAVGADHGGFELKIALKEWVRELGHDVFDLGTHDRNAVDYPDFARAVAEAVAEGRADLGICLDGAGIGSAIAANKVPGVRAAMCYDAATARNAREHNFANVLTLGAKMLGAQVVFEIVRTFLSTAEGEERHARRVRKITAIESKYCRSRAREGS